MRKYFFSLFICFLLFPAVSQGITQPGYHINKDVDLIPNDPNGNKKIMLLTIDDGPSRYGKEMADVLVKHKAKAIFFINGTHDKYYPDTIAYEASLGFSIGNHTWNHLNLKKEKNIEKIRREVDENTKLIIERTGISPKFFRAPYGMTTSFVRNLVKEDQMIPMNWSGTAGDWSEKAKGKKAFLDNVTTTLHTGEILLIHEHKWTAKYLDDLLSIIEVQGYVFVDPDEITEYHENKI
jgi:peptidoglycan/xylan/chitin deacetylase (PgdA/CDA1 family)